MAHIGAADVGGAVAAALVVHFDIFLFSLFVIL
jgi:hypothetical protein